MTIKVVNTREISEAASALGKLMLLWNTKFKYIVLSLSKNSLNTRNLVAINFVKDNFNQRLDFIYG